MKFFEDQHEKLVTDMTSEVWKSNERLHGVRAELSLQALHAEHVSQRQNQEYAAPRQHFTGLGQQTQRNLEMFEEYRTAQPAAGPEIERLRRREEELLREVRRQKNERAKFEAEL